MGISGIEIQLNIFLANRKVKFNRHYILWVKARLGFSIEWFNVVCWEFVRSDLTGFKNMSRTDWQKFQQPEFVQEAPDNTDNMSQCKTPFWIEHFWAWSKWINLDSKANGKIKTKTSCGCLFISDQKVKVSEKFSLLC